MKRSEMVALIKEELDDLDYNDTSALADTILFLVEKAGMLPPYRQSHETWPVDSFDDVLERHYTWEKAKNDKPSD